MWPGAVEAVADPADGLRAAPFVAWRLRRVRVAGGLPRRRRRGSSSSAASTSSTPRATSASISRARAAASTRRRTGRRGRPRRSASSYRGRTTITLSRQGELHRARRVQREDARSDRLDAMTLPDQSCSAAAGPADDAGRRSATSSTRGGASTRRPWSPSRSAADPDAPGSTSGTTPSTLRGGAEWTRDRLTVRGGGYFDPSPVPAEHLVPTSPDASRARAHRGRELALRAPSGAADLFAERMWLLRRDTTSTDTMPASYGGTATILGAGVRLFY